ncbi:MAG: tol-pal system YbgF family protein [Bradymonadaceae bacterium]
MSPHGARLGPLLAALVIGGFAVGPGVSSIASAQKTDAQRGKKVFEKGRRLYQNEKYQKAADAFSKAYDLTNRSELLFNIGKAYAKAGKPQKAEKYFQKYLEANPNAPNEQQVVQKIIELQEKIAARMGTVKVKTAKEGRSVFLGDEKKPRCQSPCSLSLAPGVHHLEIRAEGMVPKKERIALGKSESKTVEVKLKPEINPGRLYVETSARGGTVTIEGEGQHSLPLDGGVKLDPGTYNIRIASADGATWTGTAEIKDDQETRIFVPLGATSEGGSGDTLGHIRRGAAYGLAGVSVALLAGGAVVGSQAQDTHDLLTSRQRANGSVDGGLVDQGREQMKTANILLGAGVGALVTGAGLFTWDLLASSK